MEEITLNEEDANTEDSPKLGTEDDKPADQEVEESSIIVEEAVAEISIKPEDEATEKEEEDVKDTVISERKLEKLNTTACAQSK